MQLFRGILALVVACGLVLTVGSAAPQRVLAAEIDVDGVAYTCDFAGLAGAVAAAQAGDIINFECGEAPEIAFEGNGPIEINKALTIDGDGDGGSDENDMVFDGGQQSNFFHVTSDGALTLESISLESGEAEKGGAIYVAAGGHLTLDNYVGFYSNYADEPDVPEDAPESGYGGAIYVEAGGEVVIHSATFDDNAAGLFGGAIYLAEGESDAITKLSISRTTFEDNWVWGEDLSAGGAIYSEGDHIITITNTIFDHNGAEGIFGGAMLVDGGKVSIYDTRFEDNGSFFGGAILGDSVELNIFRSFFSENIATWSGGAVAIQDNSKAIIDQSVFADNETFESGGAIDAFESTSLKISRSVFNNNSTGNKGGAINNEKTAMDINASTFLNNTNGDGEEGSTIETWDNDELQAPISISWSTIVQPEGETDSALSIGTDVTLTGVIMAGPGAHCDYDDYASLHDSYTLSNEDSCDLGGEGSAVVDDVGLDDPVGATIFNIPFTYFPLAAGSPAHDAGPASCDTEVQPGNDTDQLGNSRPEGPSCDIGAIEVNNLPPQINFVGVSGSTIDEGNAVTIDIQASEHPNEPEGSLQYAVDCDVSDDVEPEFSANNVHDCVYPDNGEFDGLAVVSDGYATLSSAFHVSVNNVAPVVTGVNVVSPVPINHPVTFQMIATDVPADTLVFTYNCGVGADISTAPVSSTTGEFTVQGTCTYSEAGNYPIGVTAVDDDGSQSAAMTVMLEVYGHPSTLCVDQWTQQLQHVPEGEDCGTNETLIHLPEDGPIFLCVNTWNGAVRMATECNRSESLLNVLGDGSISICVNRWNGSFRVSDRCSRSEVQDVL